MAEPKTLDIDIEEEAATLLECENSRLTGISGVIEDVHKCALDLHGKLGALCTSIKAYAEVFKRASAIFSSDDSNIPCVVTASKKKKTNNKQTDRPS